MLPSLKDDDSSSTDLNASNENEELKPEVDGRGLPLTDPDP